MEIVAKVLMQQSEDRLKSELHARKMLKSIIKAQNRAGTY